MNEEERIDMYADAYLKWGKEKQLDMAIEEMAELMQAILHKRRGRVTLQCIANEVADTEIMLEQLRFIYNHECEEDLDFNEMVDDARKVKLNRLKERLEQ